MYVAPVVDSEREDLIAIAVQTGLFTSSEAEDVLGTVLTQLTTGRLPEGHAAVACRVRLETPAVGWAYFAPDQYADRVWNVWWIGVLPEQHGRGVASALLTFVENAVAESGGRVLIIETSDSEVLGRARRFYEKRGYVERGRIPQFYAENEAKVIFSKHIVRSVE